MSYKPIGGVSRIILKVAPLCGATDSTTYQEVEAVLLEDSSTYTQSCEWFGSTPQTTHALTLKCPIDYDLTQLEELEDGLYQGFHAEVYMRSGQIISLFEEGSSVLYLKQSSVDYGTASLDCPYRLYSFEGKTNS